MLPISAGELERLPPIAVKLNGVTAKHEALERPVLHPVPDAGRRDRLLRVDAQHELDVEAEEVDQLAGGVDLGLVRGLRLAEHRRRVERRRATGPASSSAARRKTAARSSHGRRDQSAVRLARGVDRLLRRARRRPSRRRRARAPCRAASPPRVVSWSRRPRRRSRAGSRCARDSICAEPRRELLALGGARREALDRLVHGRRRPKDARAAHGRDCRVGGDARDAASLRVEGWGVGELWVGDGRLVLAHDPPARAHPNAGRRRELTPTHPQGHPGCPYRHASGETVTGARRLRRGSAAKDPQLLRRASASRSPTSSSTSRARRRSSARLADALRRVPWGEVVTYGELAALAGCPRAARAAGTFCAENRFSLVRAVPPRRRRRRDRRLRLARRRVQAPAARARGACRSLTTCATSSPRSRRRGGCCRLAELSALFHSAGTRHLRGRGELAVHLDLASRAVARRAFSLLRELRRRLGDPHVPPPGVRPRDPLPAARRRDDRHAPPCSARRASSPRAARRSSARRSASSAASCCRGAYLRGALLGAGSLSGPRSPHLELRAPRGGRRVPARSTSPRRRASRSASLDRGRHAVAYAKGARDDRRPPRRRRRERDRARASTSTASWRGTSAEANRLANADDANLVRTADAAQRAARGDRAARRRARACPKAPGDRSPPTATSVALAHGAGRRSAARRSRRQPPTTAWRMLRQLAEMPDSLRHRPRQACSHARASRAFRAEKAGRRGSSEEDLPLRLNHAPDRWRRTGSESGAGRAWTRQLSISRRSARSR